MVRVFLIHRLTKVHGDGELEDQEEQVDAKEEVSRVRRGFPEGKGVRASR